MHDNPYKSPESESIAANTGDEWWRYLLCTALSALASPFLIASLLSIYGVWEMLISLNYVGCLVALAISLASGFVFVGLILLARRCFPS
jgi:hypothetical protein